MSRSALLLLVLLQGCACTTRETSITAQASSLCYTFALSVQIKEVR